MTSVLTGVLALLVSALGYAVGYPHNMPAAYISGSAFAVCVLCFMHAWGER